MFTRLRNKFLILNMSITSIVMIAAFAVIYFITYSSIESEIQESLNARSQMHFAKEETDLPAQNFSLDGPASFNIQVDGDGEILKKDSLIELPEEAYSKAAETAWNSSNGNSTVILEGRQWRYNINPIQTRVIWRDGQQFILDDNLYNLVFLDVTEFNRTLGELLTTLIFVGTATLILIFLVSLFFANRAIEPIARSWEKQKQFVADASHELKTPLSIINANYDALVANQEDSIKNQMKWLNYMRIGTDRMAKLIEGLLSLAREEDAEIEIQKVPFNISREILDIVLSMEALMIDKGISLSYSIDPDIVVKGDCERVKEVVMILLDNAVKYTNEKGWIDISLKETKGRAKFSVTNSGKGIAREDLPKVFDRFYRGDPSRTHEGSYGLGLSIAKTIIHKMGGEMEAKSVENESAGFSFTLGL